MTARRFTAVEPLDVPPAGAATRMGLTVPQFTAALPALLLRGFPAPDQTTGNFDLEAIDDWRRARHRPHLAAVKATPAMMADRISKL